MDENGILRDKYATSYSREDIDRLMLRRAEENARFFIPHLRSGMTLLDCGCGPGTITADLADIVSPGRTVGLDPEEKQIREARAYAASRDQKYLTYQIGSVHDLPFPDESFDAVFMHAVCEHITDVPRAFAEVRRVLRPGGVFGVRSGDVEASILWPDDPQLRLAWEICEKVYREDGRHLYFGRRQLAVLRQAGFERIAVSASYDCWSRSPPSKVAHSQFIQKLCLDSWIAEKAVSLGIADTKTLADTAEAWRAWAEDSDSFMAEARAEAVAWNE
jgi:ubiquinone/menaquinone biosynthesis C-methylase UbiE